MQKNLQLPLRKKFPLRYAKEQNEMHKIREL
jgi:hypothetical protein